MRRALILTFALPALACDPDCANSARVNGSYAMWHTVTTPVEDLSMDIDYPSYLVFINGWSKWDVAYQSSDSSANISVKDVGERYLNFNEESPVEQTYGAEMKASDDNCNVFDFKMTGVFQTTSNTTHDFTYTAQLVFLGDHLSGSFTYEDTYTGTDADGAPISGGISGASGEVSGTLQTDADGVFDTGFSEE